MGRRASLRASLSLLPSLQRQFRQGQPKEGDTRQLRGSHEVSHFNNVVRVLFGDSGQTIGMFSDRRSSDRKAINTRAIVVWGDEAIRAFAIILDLSDTGLRIRLDQDAEIGREGYILFEHRMEPFRVAWQASRSAGLQFTMPMES